MAKQIKVLPSTGNHPDRVSFADEGVDRSSLGKMICRLRQNCLWSAPLFWGNWGRLWTWSRSSVLIPWGTNYTTGVSTFMKRAVERTAPRTLTNSNCIMGMQLIATMQRMLSDWAESDQPAWIRKHIELEWTNLTRELMEGFDEGLPNLCCNFFQ